MNDVVVPKHYDIVIIGSGPAGQKAAIQAAKAGKRVALIERDKMLGGACVYRGTIPSKTLRENALRVADLRSHAQLFSFEIRPDLEMSSLIENMAMVISAHEDYITKQIKRNRIDRIHGRASFTGDRSIDVHVPGGDVFSVTMDNTIICTGSVPRQPDNIEIDHEHIYDSDSVLSMLYLPETLMVFGGGVIACEYATIFASLGVKVTMIDRYPGPLGFLDDALAQLFLRAIQDGGVEFIANANVNSVEWDGISQVLAKLEDGRCFSSDKLLVAAGRVANVNGLNIEQAGLSLNEYGVISVDGHCRTRVESIYAAGDVVGPPSLASASMEQGRRASCAVLGIDLGNIAELIPAGIYAIPELSTVGMSETQVRERYGEPIVGISKFEEIARGLISDIHQGQLRLIADPKGQKLLGVQIIGEGATELIHIGQMALLADMKIDAFVENIFNFPTLAEAYRVAALSVVGQRS